MGKHEAHPGALQTERGNDRLEIMAVGAESVQPDHRAPDRPAGLDLDALQLVGHPREDTTQPWYPTATHGPRNLVCGPPGGRLCQEVSWVPGGA